MQNVRNIRTNDIQYTHYTLSLTHFGKVDFTGFFFVRPAKSSGTTNTMIVELYGGWYGFTYSNELTSDKFACDKLASFSNCRAKTLFPKRQKFQHLYILVVVS